MFQSFNFLLFFVYSFPNYVQLCHNERVIYFGGSIDFIVGPLMLPAAATPYRPMDVDARYCLGSQTNDAASKTSASIAGSFAEFMATNAKVIDISMYDKRTSDNVVEPIQRNQFIANVHFGHTIGIGFNVAQIADMTNSRIGSTVLFLRRIEMWSGRCASICIITEFMHMETMFAGSEAAYFAGDCDGSVFGCLIRYEIELKRI